MTDLRCFKCLNVTDSDKWMKVTPNGTNKTFTLCPVCKTEYWVKGLVDNR